MAEEFLFNIIGEIITKSASRALQEIGLCWGVKDELVKLQRTVSTIQAVLLDAEEKSSTNHEIKVWLQMLKEAAYDADDLLDDFSTEALRRRVTSGNRIMKEVRLFFSHSNQFVYGQKMGHKIRDIRERLVEIAENRKFHLDERQVELATAIPKEREQTHSSLPDLVVGREDDKKHILELLLSSEYEDNVSIISIVGIGGLGKTTLAQLVYNDEIVKSHFELKLWACVSDNFDVKGIVEKILESVIGEKPLNRELNTLKNLLHEKINGKRYLLVLDDVWNENTQKWFDLKDLLVRGARGSKIIVTTRLKNVAMMIKSDKIYELYGLVDADSWSLFTKMAFKQGQPTSKDHERVGKEIAAKFAGVPLALKAIGRVLYFKSTISEWLSFKDGELANLKEENNILSILRLSYNRLPPHLKRCFASYCGLFPKNTTISVQYMVGYWMAHGYIKPSDSKQCLEDIGLQYFKELLWRSFFQNVQVDRYGNLRTFEVHDLMHDLAVQVAGEEITVLNADVESVKEGTRHLSLGSQVVSLRQVAHVLPSARKVRTLTTIMYRFNNHAIKEEECKMIFSNLRRLRVLDLSDLGIDRVPHSIDKLKHIRFLDLSDNKGIEILPDSITRLQNLQTLNLCACEKLKQLPKDFKKLVNLRQLLINGCVSLTHMPHGLSQLTSIQFLSAFILGKDEFVSKHGGRLGELGGLNNLRDHIHILNLRYVKKNAAASEFQAANLKEKQHLQGLILAWKLGYYDDHNSFGGLNDDVDGKDEVLLSIKELQPHVNLKWLDVFGWGRLEFPSWVSSLTNLVYLKVDNCKKCKSFPPLDQLPSLKHMGIFNFTDLEYIEQSNEMSGLFFPSLQHLWLSNCPYLKGWRRSDTDTSTAQLVQFHCLVYLEISSCPNLIAMPLIPSVENLLVKNTSVKSLEDILKMNISIPTSSSSSPFPALYQLKGLAIQNIEDVEFLPEELMQNLTSLKQLDIVDCPTLTTLPRALRHLTSLEVLIIIACARLDFSDDNDDDSGSILWQCLSSLKELQFISMLGLVSLPKELQNVCTLRKLIIKNCTSLKSLPEWMPNLTSLQFLWIYNCPQLPDDEWQKIAHIPNIIINETQVQADGHFQL